MKVRQIPRLTAIAHHQAVRSELRLSKHGVERARERASLNAVAALDAVLRRSLVLPYTGLGCTYHLFLQPETNEFFVAVVASEVTTRMGGLPHVKTVLTLSMFESYGGRVSRRLRRMAAAKSLPTQAEFRAWDVNTYGDSGKLLDARVITYFSGPDALISHVVDTRAHVCRAFAEEHGLENAFGHPGFPEWYRRRLDAHGISPESVVSIRIADTDKLTLRIDAETRACPHCVISRQ